MEALQGIRIRVVPMWLKWALTLGLLALVSFSGWLVVTGVRDERLTSIEASAYLLAVVLPMVVVATLLAFSSGGTKALERRTHLLLAKVIPAQFVKTFRLEEGALSSDVGPFEAEYTFPLKGRRVGVRVEVNVRRANVGFYVAPVAGKKVPASIPHSLEGASADPSCYSWRDDVLLWNGASLFVLSRVLEQDFLWDASDQLFFSRDLVMMVRSMVEEAPALFPEWTVDDET